MTRLDPAGPELVEAGDPCDGPRALLLEIRDVPLGGVRGMAVHRALPQRDLPTVGAWCFLDRFGPQVARMRVEPHPHIGLQTVTWPFEGDVRHRDSVGSDVVVRRGALNLMTSGAGIAHSEYSVGDDAVPLDALQLWVALPESRRHGAPAFERHENLPHVQLDGDAVQATVVLGTFAGVASPATVYTPIVGAELRLAPGTRAVLPLDSEWEHALVCVEGSTAVETGMPVARGGAPGGGPGGAPNTDAATAASATPPEEAASVVLDTDHLLYLGVARDGVEVAAGDAGATLFLLGGEPFEDDIVMWWNFVARSHDEIVAAREAWETDADAATPRFGHVAGHGRERIPAPPLPGVRLTQRRRRV